MRFSFYKIGYQLAFAGRHGVRGHLDPGGQAAFQLDTWLQRHFVIDVITKNINYKSVPCIQIIESDLETVQRYVVCRSA